MARRSAFIALVALPLMGLVVSGCGGGAPMHSVADVRATFARHGLRLSVVERNRVSTSLLPSSFVRTVRKTPALGRLPSGRVYEVVVITNRHWLRDLSRHRRVAQRTTRHDNIVIIHPSGAPKALPPRLSLILNDI